MNEPLDYFPQPKPPISESVKDALILWAKIWFVGTCAFLLLA